jgi:REP element-mobilizing transposase RayT
VNWLPVFTTPSCREIIVNAFEHARQHKSLQIYAWVILDNHIHAIVAGPNLSQTIGKMKSFTARMLIEQVRSEGRDWLLNQLEYYCAKHKKAEGQPIQVWQEGSHPQSICSDAMMLQKLEYIHLNPVRRGWVVAPEHWRYSSAHAWLEGAIPLLKCDDWRG